MDWVFKIEDYPGAERYKRDHPPPYTFRIAQMVGRKVWENILEGGDIDVVTSRALDVCHENMLPTVVTVIGSRGHGIRYIPLLKMYFHRRGKPQFVNEHAQEHGLTELSEGRYRPF